MHLWCVEHKHSVKGLVVARSCMPAVLLLWENGHWQIHNTETFSPPLNYSCNATRPPCWTADMNHLSVYAELITVALENNVSAKGSALFFFFLPACTFWPLCGPSDNKKQPVNVQLCLFPPQQCWHPHEDTAGAQHAGTLSPGCSVHFKVVCGAIGSLAASGDLLLSVREERKKKKREFFQAPRVSESQYGGGNIAAM